MKINKLEYLFSYNNKIGSHIIKWGTNHQNETEYMTPSHVAVLINGNLVIESTLFTGVRLIPYKKWLEINTIAHKVPCPQEREWHHVMQCVFKTWGKKYDYKGIMFFAWHLFKNKFFKTPLPTYNEWQSDNKFFCVEIIENITGESYEMTSPVALMNCFVNGSLEV